MPRSTFIRRLTSFAVFLPLLDLLIWVALVLTPVVLLYIQSQDLSLGPEKGVNVDYNFNVRRDDLVTIPLTDVKVSRTHAIGTIGLPATIVETLLSAPSVLASSWHAADFHLDSVRSLVYPIYCIPVWWFVGIGADGLFRKRKIGLPSLVAGTALMLLFIAIVIGLRSAPHANDSTGDFNWILRALGIWILMFAVFPAVWLKQLLMPKMAEKLSERLPE